MKIGHCLGVFFALACALVCRAEDANALELVKLEKSLQYQSGDCVVGSNLATLHLGADYRFLNSADAKKVLVDGWGNPPAAAEGVLGMITHKSDSPLDATGWGVVITYDDEGHIDDADASGIDYNELLTTMKKGTEAGNKKRVAAGYDAMHLVGWAKTPSYDASAKKLIWAKELAFEGDEGVHSLNYDVRVLGRTGVLSLNAVGGMDQLSLLETTMADVATHTEFNPGNRYADYQPGSDRVAAYGVAGLIAGGVAAKAGLFKGLIALLLAAKKLIVIGLIALVVILKKVFSSIGGGGGSATPTTPTA